MCNLTYVCHWRFVVISKGRNRHFLALHPRCSMNFKFQDYRKTTTKISCEFSIISFSSVIYVVECMTATHPVLCALPSMLGCNLQFPIWKIDLLSIISWSRSENYLVSTTLKNVHIQLQLCCPFWHVNLLCSFWMQEVKWQWLWVTKTRWRGNFDLTGEKIQKDKPYILTLIQILLYETVLKWRLKCDTRIVLMSHLTRFLIIVLKITDRY